MIQQNRRPFGATFAENGNAMDEVRRILDMAGSARCSSETFIIGIGAQRSGTTWISRYLDKHPEVAFSPIKELHVFDSLLLR